MRKNSGLRLLWLSVVALGCASVYGQQPATTQAGFDVSIVMPSNEYMTTIGAGGVLDYGWSLGTAGAIHFHPNIELWFANGDYYYPGNRFYYYHSSDFETAINFEGRYYFPLPSTTPVKPYVGLGPAIIFSYFHHDNYAYPYDYYPYHSGVSMGFNLMGGIDFKLGRSMAFVEMKGKVGSYVDVFKLTFGMMFPLGR
jgi:hypothetical protein